VGIGELVLAGCLGPVALLEVLHVLDLESPLFSVEAALCRGLSVHFSPPAQPCGMDTVVIMHNGQMLFTATSRVPEELYFLDQGYFAAAGAVSVQQHGSVIEIWGIWGLALSLTCVAKAC
jgi:hypothetical protein